MAISLEFTLKRQDFEESLMIYTQSKPYLRYLGILLTYILLILFGFLAFLKVYALINNDIYFLKRVDQSLLISAGFVLFCNLRVWHKAMTWFMWKVAPFLKEPVFVQIEDSGFSYKNAVMKSEIEWSAVQQVLESNQVFFILHKLKASYTLPKRSFTPEDMNEFKQILAANTIQIERK
ncbi:YcxB family protein [Laspinema sp. A4]|uniref:YcxB family protein n=1 Tax=Laspinema sp. D2d TaxID=2953686 RepID=UPI0021BB536C|nr:YcxB family protein [Laspinema sp. D2d]MCT7981869.1 YcxB family protein [Laspinema sp. D2d]